MLTFPPIPSMTLCLMHHGRLRVSGRHRAISLPVCSIAPVALFAQAVSHGLVAEETCLHSIGLRVG